MSGLKPAIGKKGTRTTTRLADEMARREALTQQQRDEEDAQTKLRMQEEAAENERQRRASWIADRMREAGITRRHSGCTFENYQASTPQAKEVLSTCKRYATNIDAVLESGAGLILCGNTGTGKTHIAMATVKHWVNAGHPAKYATIPDVLAEIRRTYNFTDKNEQTVIDDYSNTQLLVLDEAGAGRNSDHSMEMLFTIVNNRSNNVLPTVLISNLKYSDLSEAVGDRVISRLREGGGPVLAFDWADYRSTGHA